MMKMQPHGMCVPRWGSRRGFARYLCGVVAGLILVMATGLAAPLDRADAAIQYKTLNPTYTHYWDNGSNYTYCVYAVTPGQKVKVHFAYTELPWKVINRWYIQETNATADVAFAATYKKADERFTAFSQMLASVEWSPSKDETVTGKYGEYTSETEAYDVYDAGITVSLIVPASMHYLVTWWDSYYDGGGSAQPMTVRVVRDPVSVGTTVTMSGIRYKVTRTGTSKGTVAVMGAASKKTSSVAIPSAIKINGYGYKVTSVAAQAFKGCRRLKRFTCTSANLERIGAQCFSGAVRLKTLTIAQATRLSKAGVKGSLKNSKITTVKVRSSKIKAYRKIFTKHNCGRVVVVRKG